MDCISTPFFECGNEHIKGSIAQLDGEQPWTPTICGAEVQSTPGKGELHYRKVFKNFTSLNSCSPPIAQINECI